MKKLLVVVDMQNDFIDGALGTQEAVAILPEVKKTIASAQAEGTEIVYTRDTHTKDYLSSQEGKRLPVEHCIVGTEGHAIREGLYVGGKVFDKPTFGSMELASYVQAGGYGDVTLIGLCTDICVISNALLIKAYCPEARVAVIASACAGVSVSSHENALSAMKVCQVDVL